MQHARTTIDGCTVDFYVGETPEGFCGAAKIHTPQGPVCIAAKFPMSMVRQFAAANKERLTRFLNQEVEVGRRRRRLRGLFRGKVIRKLGGVAKKILNSKVVRGAMKVARLVPGYGQAIDAAYKTARRASNVAANLGRGGRRGQAARQGVQALRAVAQNRGGQRARQMASRLLGRSGITAATARQALRGTAQRFSQQYGGALRRMAQQGAISSGSDLAIVAGAMSLWGNGAQQSVVTSGEFMSELDALDRVGVGYGSVEIGRRRRRRRGIFKRMFVPFAAFKRRKKGRGSRGGRPARVQAGFALYKMGWEDNPDSWFRRAYYEGLRILSNNAANTAAGALAY